MIVRVALKVTMVVAAAVAVSEEIGRVLASDDFANPTARHCPRLFFLNEPSL